MHNRINTLQIRTPEGIVFSQILAAPVTRCLAWVIDALAIAALAQLSGYLTMFFGLISVDVAMALYTLLYFGISMGYGILFEWFWRGQTIGKKVMRLRVMDAWARRLHFSQIVIRNLLRFIDALPLFYLVGGITCLLNRRSQRLGDIAANTVVIRHPKITEPDLEQLLAGKYNSLRAYPHLIARLRQRVSPAEAGLALGALMRREELESAARVKLFQDVADYFRSLVAFPAEATDGVADEQYIRNIVDVLFRKCA